MSADERFGLRQRRYLLVGILLTLAVLMSYKLVMLQFVEFAAFRSQAEQNSIRRIAREPMRGLIYDRDMNLLVGNNPSYTLTITPFEFRWSALATLQGLFGIDSHLVRYRIAQEGKNSFEPVKIMRDLTFEMISILEENRAALPGVSYLVESCREYYNMPRLAHLLGNIKEISPVMLQRMGSYYKPGDVVGANGVEAFYEPVLRGNKGYGFYTVNSHGKVVESFDHGQSDIPASEGADIMLTLDMKLQQYVESLMRHRRGALVAMDPRNGEVLACTSSPDYDPRALSGRIPVDVWNALNTDEAKPLYNRWAMAAYPPGSTFKMMIAAAALQEGIIDESTTINCPGSYTLAGVTFKCHGAHGNVNVVHAIEYSCNVFFYKLIFKLGFEDWSRYGSMFHFGRRTGVDISNESTGTLPSEEYYNKRYGKRWNKGYLVSLGIGQGEVNTTPLQMAAYVSTIANGGTYYRPHVVRAIVDRMHGGRKDIPVVSQQLPISPRVWSIIQTGMYRVVNGSGTGYAARVGGINVAGKTGTAQNPHGKDHAWFVAFAPLKDPKIALAILVENGGYGGDAAAPLAGAIMRQFFYGRTSASAAADSTGIETTHDRRQPAASSLAD
jgi:penicillin-binding protein 2